MDTNTLVDIWSWFTNFPVGLATGAGAWVVVINSVIAILVVFWRRSTLEMSKPMLCVPWMLYGIAGFAGWLAGVFSGDVSGFLWVAFSVFMLAALVWSVVNIIRVLFNK
jgi:hypothetical protein